MHLVNGYARDRDVKDQRKRRRTSEYKLQLKIAKALTAWGSAIWETDFQRKCAQRINNLESEWLPINTYGYLSYTVDFRLSGTASTVQWLNV